MTCVKAMLAGGTFVVPLEVSNQKMTDYHKILGVQHGASVAEIKKTFRKKAKKLHPDTGAASSDEFNRVVEAYNALLKQREDAFFTQFAQGQCGDWEAPWGREEHKPFNYHDYLMYERSDLESKAKLVFFDILHHREDEAVFLYVDLCKNHVDFRLSYWFCKEDFMDLGYILCEELALREEYYDAIVLLEEIISMERAGRYFKIFFSDVIRFAWNIVRHNIDGNLNDELSLDAWERAITMGFDEKKRVFILKKMAAVYNKIGDKVSGKYYEHLATTLKSIL